MNAVDGLGTPSGDAWAPLRAISSSVGSWAKQSGEMMQFTVATGTACLSTSDANASAAAVPIQARTSKNGPRRARAPQRALMGGGGGGGSDAPGRARRGS